MTLTLGTTSAETSARYFAERGAAAAGDVKPRRHGRIPPAYATDGIAIPRRKRRILLDLAPETVEAMLDTIRQDIGARRALGNPVGPITLSAERLLVAALERAR